MGSDQSAQAAYDRLDVHLDEHYYAGARDDLREVRDWRTDDTVRLQRERDYAVRWANQSVEMLQGAFFPVADALRALEAYLRNTPHHNAPEAAAARKALAVFDAAEVPAPTTPETPAATPAQP